MTLSQSFSFLVSIGIRFKDRVEAAGGPAIRKAFCQASSGDALTAGKHFRMFKPAYLKPMPLEALEGANLTT